MSTATADQRAIGEHPYPEACGRIVATERAQRAARHAEQTVRLGPQRGFVTPPELRMHRGIFMGGEGIDTRCLSCRALTTADGWCVGARPPTEAEAAKRRGMPWCWPDGGKRWVSVWRAPADGFVVAP